MMKKAFTMIELIFVIVIMGILAKFGFEFLAQAYNTFIFSKINSDLQARSNHAVEFIAKRLEARIPPSTIKRISSTNSFVGAPEVVTNPDDYNILEWIGYDIDGFRGTDSPLWSGIIDFDDTLTTPTQLTSPGTDTTALSNLISILSYSNSTIADAAIMFNGANHNRDSFGWDGGTVLNDQSQSIHPITSTTLNVFTSSISGVNFSGVTLYNRYMLAWTAYAVVHNPTTKELFFHYDYQPWDGESYGDGKSSLLMENVSEFRIKPSNDGRLFSIKVCVDSNLTNEEHSLCKEKTIF